MKLNGALAGAIYMMTTKARLTTAMRFRGGRTNEVDISGVGELEPMEPRHLQADADFSPLACNSNLEAETCSPLPSPFDGVVPCGVCYSTSEFQSGGSRYGETVVLSGLNIVGRLDIPEGSKVTIETPNVFVQGMLSMTSTRAVTGEPDVKIRLTGDADNFLIPEDDNAAACSSGSCNVGPKAFVVAGGQLDINGMPDACPTWSYIKDVASSEGIPSAIDYPTQPSLPTPASGAVCSSNVLSEDFEGGLKTWYGNLGALETVQTGSHDGSNYLSITERTFFNQGPLFDIPESVRECISPDTSYLFKTKIRLSGSSPSLCATSGTNCPVLQLGRMANDDKVFWDEKAFIDPNLYPGDDVWFDLLGVIEFTEEELSTDDVFKMLTINGPEAGVDISIDSISIDLPDASAYPDPNNVCGELIVNGDAELFDEFAFPHMSYKPNLQLYTKSDNGNNYFHFPSRSEYWDGLAYDLVTSCLSASSTYSFSAKVRVNSETPVVVRPTLRYLDANGDDQFDTIATCPASTAGQGFVTCSADFTFQAHHQSASTAKLFFMVADDQTSAIDYDDISFVHKSGAPTGLVLDSGITSCWDAGAEVFLPSASPDPNHYNTATVDSVLGGGEVRFAESLVSDMGPITTEAENANFAREVAMLSRNILFESDLASTIGGSLVVLRTPGVTQKIQGVLFKGFGQEGILGRNPILFKMNGDLSGSVVSKNTINLSANRCVNIHATGGLYVGENVAFDTIGHCYAVEDGGETGNTFERNLGALTKAASVTAAGEGDNRPATFFAINPENKWIDNVAAGSERVGFLTIAAGSVSGESASLYPTTRPNLSPILSFSGNVAHSNVLGIQIFNVRPTSNQYLTNTKLFRNWRNAYIANSRMLVINGGISADSRAGLEFYLTERMTVQNFKVSGYTNEYRSLANTLDGYPQFCSGTNGPSILGVKLHVNVRTDGQPGNTFSNVAFTDFGQDCGSETSAIAYNGHFTQPSFTSPTTFSGLTFESVATNKIDFCASAATGIKDIYIEDIDGSLDPDYGTGPGAIVSDDAAMDAENCVQVPSTCSLYCTDAAPGVPPESESAPAPTPVVAPAESAPSPTPPTAPSSSLPNSVDASLSTVPAPSGGICLTDDVWGSFLSQVSSVPGRSTGTAYKATGRTHQARGGPMKTFSSSCLVENEWYEIRADVLAQQAGTDTVHICNPDDPWQSSRSCPAIYIRAGSYYKDIAWTVGPYNFDGVGWNEVYGVFQATPEIMAQSEVHLHVARAPTSADITVGNAVITAASGTAIGKTDCSASNLIFNGDAETGDSRSWYIRGNLDDLCYIDIVQPGHGGSYAFKHTGQRTRIKTSMVQFLDMSCFPAGSTWSISAEFIFIQTDGSGNESPVACETCPGFEFLGDGVDGASTGYLENTLTGSMAVGDWNSYSATFTVTEAMASRNKMWVVVSGVAPGYNYYLDDIVLSRVS